MSTVNIRGFLLASLLWVGGFAGCSSGPEAQTAEAELETLSKPGGERRYHEWKEVWAGETALQRKRVGYLDRVYTESAPQGVTIVKDLLTTERGFLLPSGRALVVETDPSGSKKLRDLGFLSLEEAVRKALGVTGLLEFRTDLAASTSPRSKPAGSAPKPETKSEAGPAATPPKSSAPAPSVPPTFKSL